MNFNRLTLAIVLCAFGQLQASSRPAETMLIDPGSVIEVKLQEQEFGLKNKLTIYSADLTDGTNIVARDVNGMKSCSWVNLRTLQNGHCDESNFNILRQIYNKRQKEEKELSSGMGR